LATLTHLPSPLVLVRADVCAACMQAYMIHQNMYRDYKQKAESDRRDCTYHKYYA